MNLPSIDYPAIPKSRRAAALADLEARLAIIAGDHFANQPQAVARLLIPADAPVRQWAAGKRAWLDGQTFDRSTAAGTAEYFAALNLWLHSAASADQSPLSIERPCL